MGSFGWPRKTAEFRRRLETVQGRLLQMARAWCQDPALAADMVQEASSKALERGSQLKDMGRFDGWMFRILANCCRDHFRARHGVADDLAMDQLIDHRTPEYEHAQREVVTAVRSAIAALQPEHRYVLTLIDIEGFTYDETGHILDIPIGTVMSRVSRARNSLRDRLISLGCRPIGGRPAIRRVK